GRVDGHRCGDPPEVDVPEQILEVGEGVDRRASLSYLTCTSRVIRVASHQGGQIKSRAQPVAAGAQDLLEASIGVLRRPEPGEHPHGPRLRAVHRGVGSPGVREQARKLTVGRTVDGVDRGARHRLGAGIAAGRALEGLLPLGAIRHRAKDTRTSYYLSND